MPKNIRTQTRPFWHHEKWKVRIFSRLWIWRFRIVIAALHLYITSNTSHIGHSKRSLSAFRSHFRRMCLRAQRVLLRTPERWRLWKSRLHRRCRTDSWVKRSRGQAVGQSWVRYWIAHCDMSIWEEMHAIYWSMPCLVRIDGYTDGVYKDKYIDYESS